ncbi:putative porin [Paraburkholderia sp. RAU2J]|uniref:porin n=1 Tax=Paraburkholderia sp. RAU2J TaxID=1938810 RepID=UPI000EB52164|nr:porin [Paraburkholderia sp. RAU2J]RKT20343.1 putative porin [Paraburkholderia sp. RAU2J]
MKRKVALLVGTLVCTVCSSAHAQSSVTLYGWLDQGIQYQTNYNGGRRVWFDSASGIVGSRWGLTGKEDLGAGLSAVFTLESGINLQNGSSGQGGLLFGRQAFVGLSSVDYGAVTFGRQYDMIWYFPEFLTANAVVGASVSAHPGDFDNAGNSVRLNNAARYMSPDFRGFTFGAAYSFGGVPGNFTSTSGYSVGAGYTHGPFKIAAAFDYFKNPTSTAGSGFFTAYGNGASPLAFSLNKAYSVAQAYQSAVVGTNYVIGNLTLAASYSNVQYANLGAAFSNGTAIFNNFDIGFNYRFMPALSAGIAYDYLNARAVTTSKGSMVGTQHYNQVAFLVDYLLSKRTDLYGGAGWQRASGTSSLGTPAVANIDNQGDSSNNHTILVRIGIRHKF